MTPAVACRMSRNIQRRLFLAAKSFALTRKQHRTAPFSRQANTSKYISFFRLTRFDGFAILRGSMSETYEVKLDPIKGTFLKPPRKQRCDRGQRRKGWRWKTIKKICGLVAHLFS